MPVVFRHRGYRFFFYSNEGSPREPMQIHVDKGENEAKIWVEPAIVVAYNDGFNARTLRQLLELTQQNQSRIARASHDYFG